MNAPELQTTFRDGLREALITHAAQPEPRKPPRLYVVGGLSLSLLAIGGTAAAAGGLLPLPGGEQITELGEPMTMTGAGTGTLDLDAAPDGATKVRAEVSCLTAGTFGFPADAGSVTCSTADAEQGTGVAWVEIPLDRIGNEVTITASPEAQWSLTVTYLDAEPVPLAVNDNGDTYGIAGAPEGEPDLIAVAATNGQQGYVYADELAEADGSNAAKNFESPEEALAWQAEREGQRFAVPVYLSDGTTVIGEFVIG